MIIPKSNGWFNLFFPKSIVIFCIKLITILNKEVYIKFDINKLV